MNFIIPAPNYTQTPNDLFDHWLPLLNEGELKVLLVITRKTFGWHKQADVISISQLAKMTGLLEETVIKAAKSLQTKGIVSRKVEGPKGKQQTTYSLVVTEVSNISYPSVEPSTPLGLTPHGLTESQKKLSSKETNQKKQQQKAAPSSAANAAASSRSTKKAEPKVYPSLQPIDIPLHDKQEITKMYEEDVVIRAVEWALHQKVYTKGLAAAIKHACKHKIEYIAPKAKETPYETLCKHFKHGKLYNGAECHLKPNAICFSRGMKNEELPLDKYFKWDSFKKMCHSFGIIFKL